MSKKNELKPYRHGGKGKTAPYKTTHVRVPIEIKNKVQEFVKNWHVNKFSHQYSPKNSEIKEELGELKTELDKALYSNNALRAEIKELKTNNKNKSEIKEKIDEYLHLNNPNWNSPRNSGLKKFINWLTEYFSK
jgi:ATP-dependent Lon protease